VRAIVGTAGHIDHGKSALVRALTGLDPDRLPEEKARGISIELGFAYLEAEDGDRIGFVDVPGHERFVRHMLAGAQGFDYVLVVVAADDGVMPQTEEHFEICHLLGLGRGAFVITKSDLVSSARVEDVKAEVALLAEGTPFEGAPVFVVSAATGAGVDELRGHLLETLPNLERSEAAGGVFRLPVDRVFLLKGHGVVATGTAAGGSVAPGDDVVIAPRQVRARVREVQVHGRLVPRAWAGQRVALNLSGVSTRDIARGDTVAAAAAGPGTRRFDARIEVRPAARRPLRSHERVRLHLATSERLARIVWLGGTPSVAPKQTALAQIVVSDMAVLTGPGDRFVLRDETGQRTVGGGRVLLVEARRHRHDDCETPKLLSDLEAADSAGRVRAYLELSSGLGAPVTELACALTIPEPEIAELVSGSDRFVRLGGEDGTAMVVTRARYERYTRDLSARVRAHHLDVTSSPGLEIERLRQRLVPRLDARLFRILVDLLCAEGLLERKGAIVSVPGHAVHMSPRAERSAEALLAKLREAGSMPPSFAELQDLHGLAPAALHQVLGVLVERRQVVKVSSDLYFAKDTVDEMGSKLRQFLEREGRITPAGFRDLIEASRKYTIPLLDYFDRSGLTVRCGDYRQLQ
jgi:selenocysteine-specific elongation factor